jgi:hypothetical protein
VKVRFQTRLHLVYFNTHSVVVTKSASITLLVSSVDGVLREVGIVSRCLLVHRSPVLMSNTLKASAQSMLVSAETGHGPEKTGCVLKCSLPLGTVADVEEV